jgi:tetratricopeptide (TPR) repeat protein
MIPVILILTTSIQHLVLSHWYDPRSVTSLRDTVLLSVILAAVISAVILMYFRRDAASGGSVRARFSRPLGIVVGVVLLVMLGNQARHFERWWSMSGYSLEQANRDLGAILGNGAILTGGYGTALTQDADSLGNFPAMFGVSEVDREFFQKYPVTHVAEVDQQDQPFFRNYPAIAQGAQRVTTYFIRNMPISVYRVSALGNNPDAAGYHLSAFERMRTACEDLPRDTVLSFLPSWVADSADFYSGWRWLGDLYYNSDRLDDARDAYGRAAQSFSDDFSLWALIGDVSWEIFRLGSGGEDRRKAIDAWTRALRLSPQNPQLLERMNRAYVR